MRHLSRIAAAALLVTVPLAGCSGGDDKADKKGTSASGASAASSGADSASSASSNENTEFTAKKTASGVASNTTSMKMIKQWSGRLTTKSVDANGYGLVVANNMIYTHTITLFNAGSGKRIADIPDTVDLQKFGLSGKPLTLKGGPVEAAWTKDGNYLYVSNYVMSGPGYNDEPNDLCKPGNKYKPSYVYRVNVREKKIDQVIEAGAVPKYVALTHDGSKLLVSNWCSYSMSVIDTKTKKQIKQIPIGTWPRGIAVSPDNKYAYVAAFGTSNLYRVDLAAGKSSVFANVGGAARHVTMSPDGKYLYVVASHGNSVSKVDRESGKIVGRTTGLTEPRSMTISPDGKAIYVVNYFDSSVSKIDTSTMKAIQKVKVGSLPIGITYEPRTGQVWVAMYSGTIDVFDDNKAASTH